MQRKYERYEGKATGEAIRRLLRQTGEQPYIIIRTTKPNAITEGVKVDPANSTDRNGKIQLGCRSSMWNGIRFWFWNDAGDSKGDNEITYIEY